jgi:2-polyprenyl-3-methyl-5-hydroxy-6-metoxy-1,4-benzoquinol methylase
MSNGYNRYEYSNYKEYINVQLGHSRTKYRTVRRPFTKYLNRLALHFPECKKVLCVGSRDVSEVQALRKAGYDAIGIDLFSEDVTVIKILDMHNIASEFAEDEFDLVYACHALEHSYDPEKVLTGIKKVSKTGAFIVLPFLSEPHSKDPTQFNFMKAQFQNKKLEVSEIKVLIEKDFASLGCSCEVTDLQVNPLGNNDDGYWISLLWK